VRDAAGTRERADCGRLYASYVNVRMYECINAYIHVSIYVCCMYVRGLTVGAGMHCVYMYACMDVCIDVCIYVCCMFVCRFVGICICMCECVCVCEYVRVCLCMNVSMLACIDVCMHIGMMKKIDEMQAAKRPNPLLHRPTYPPTHMHANKDLRHVCSVMALRLCSSENTLPSLCTLR